MIQWVRSVFKFQPGPVKKVVLGTRTDLNLKDANHIQNSDSRLKLLQTLCTQYKGTTHEHKINLVFEKTKSIHSFLVDQKRLTELELFHLQQTDHFINTFAIIKAAYAKTVASKIDALSEDDAQAKPALAGRTELEKTQAKPPTAPEPDLLVPAIAIDTFTRIKYVRLGTAGDFSTHEIGFTSTYEEKGYFLATIAARVGVYKPDIAYVGNARVNLKNKNTSQLSYVPIINWRGGMYAVCLNDYRLYPVKINHHNG